MPSFWCFDVELRLLLRWLAKRIDLVFNVPSLIWPNLQNALSQVCMRFCNVSDSLNLALHSSNLVVTVFGSFSSDWFRFELKSLYFIFESCEALKLQPGRHEPFSKDLNSWWLLTWAYSGGPKVAFPAAKQGTPDSKRALEYGIVEKNPEKDRIKQKPSSRKGNTMNAAVLVNIAWTEMTFSGKRQLNSMPTVYDPHLYWKGMIS